LAIERAKKAVQAAKKKPVDKINTTSMLPQDSTCRKHTN
jgi:hypothetical protein